jgi:hypothetical protein
MSNGLTPGARKDVDSRGELEKDVDSRGDVEKDVDSRGGAAAAAAGLFGGCVPPAQVATDLFGRAAALGGWLLVSFVAPIPACAKPAPRTPVSSRMRSVAAAAERRDALDVQKLQEQKRALEDQKRMFEQQQKELAELMTLLKGGLPASAAQSASQSPPDK